MDLSRPATFAVIRDAIVTVLRVPEEQVLEPNQIRDMRNVDSMALMEIIAFVEDALQIDIDVGSLFEVHSVGEFVDICHDLRSSHA